MLSYPQWAWFARARRESWLTARLQASVKDIDNSRTVGLRLASQVRARYSPETVASLTSDVLDDSTSGSGIAGRPGRFALESYMRTWRP
jgi:hypothetical protein